MLFGKHFHRQEIPWEVVDAKVVAPVPVWDEDDGESPDAFSSSRFQTDTERPTT